MQQLFQVLRLSEQSLLQALLQSLPRLLSQLLPQPQRAGLRCP